MVKHMTPDASTATPRRRDRRHVRHEATRREILDLAWAMARRDGLTAVSLSALARAVGIEPQSMYTYFPSKNAVFDAMFAEGNRELVARMTATTWPDDARAMLQLMARLFLEFSTEDSARHQLLFERVLPDFEPTPESYAIAVEALEHGRALLAKAGITDDADLDLWTALVSGLANQQLANDPGGDRWLRLTDRAVEMYIRAVKPRR